MTTHNQTVLAQTVTAAEDLSAASARFKAITLAGLIVPTATAAGASARALGINITSARSGEQATAVVNGIVKVVAGAAVSTLGYPIMVGSLGFMFAANSGFSHVGRAIETAASGDLFKAMVDFTSLPLWSGA
jgi:hypothetical protein